MSNCHVWIKLKDPSDVTRFRTAVMVKAAEVGLTWTKPKYNRKTGEVCAQSLTTLFDTSVLTTGRFVFVGKPTVKKGLKVKEPEFQINEGWLDSEIDTSALELPSAERISEITKTAGVEMHINNTNGELKLSVHDLTYETELETQSHGVITVADAIKISGTIRCQSPFRDSSSWAGLFSIGNNGSPIVYDFGTSTTHRIANDAAYDFREDISIETTHLKSNDNKWVKGEEPFALHSAQEILSTASLDWLIKGVLPSSGLGVLYGESGSGKTFITLDMAMHLARGEDWQGKRTKQVGVLYLAAEGAAGLSLRLQAYSSYHNLDLTGLPLFAITEAANLLEKGDKRLLHTCLNANQILEHQVKLIIIDTLNRSMPGGDENSSHDMSKVVDCLAKIAKKMNVFVLIIHHSGKDVSKGARGHSSLKAAVDVELEVKRDGEVRLLTLTKSRDGQDGTKFANKLEIVNLGLDDDLDEITSCVAVPGSLSDATSNKIKPQGKHQIAAYEALQIALSDADFNENPAQVSTETVLKIMEQAPDKCVRWKETAKKAIDDLVKKGLISREGTTLWL